MEPYIGEIRLFAGNFAPNGWAFCNGQLLPISRYTAVFSLLGTNYGGDGRTTFALPNLQGRTPIHQGTGPGLTPRSLGEMGGSETVSLNSQQLPPHTHAARGSTVPTGPAPAGTIWSGLGGRDAPKYYGSGTPNTPMATTLIAPSGGGGAHNNLSPYVTLNYIIALEGIFPPRS
jgi:microcystin-dependent protein